MPLKSAQFFDLMKSGIAEQGPDLVKKVNAVITFNVAPGGCWTSESSGPQCIGSVAVSCPAQLGSVQHQHQRMGLALLTSCRAHL